MRRFILMLAVFLSGGACGACVTALTQHAEELAAKVERAVGGAADGGESGRWSEGARKTLAALCHRAHDGDFFEVAHGCDCLVSESEKRIPEDQFLEWVLSRGQLNGEEVVRLGTEAEKVCRDRIRSS